MKGLLVIFLSDQTYTCILHLRITNNNITYLVIITRKPVITLDLPLLLLHQINPQILLTLIQKYLLNLVSSLYSPLPRMFSFNSTFIYMTDTYHFHHLAQMSFSLYGFSHSP